MYRISDKEHNVKLRKSIVEYILPLKKAKIHTIYGNNNKIMSGLSVNLKRHLRYQRLPHLHFAIGTFKLPWILLSISQRTDVHGICSESHDPY